MAGGNDCRRGRNLPDSNKYQLKRLTRKQLEIELDLPGGSEGCVTKIRETAEACGLKPAKASVPQMKGHTVLRYVAEPVDSSAVGRFVEALKADEAFEFLP